LNSKNLIHELIEKGYDLEKLKPYEDFLIECTEKNYNDLPTQNHHILPKSMNDGKYAKETITLSLLDHFNAHLVLANCFDGNTDEKRKNLSACKYIKVHVKKYMVKMNFQVPKEFHEFWNLAHEIMKDFNRGENNTFFGKKHSEETKAIIKEKRKLQTFTDETRKKLSDGSKGDKNHFFGRSHSPETKKMISETKKLQNANKPKIEKPLPEGIFKCNEIVDGELKRYFRYCSNEECGEVIYYRGKENGLGQPITVAHKNNVCCSKCRFKTYKRTKPTIKINHTSNHLIIKDTITGIVYNSMSDAVKQLNIPRYKVKKKIKNDLFEIIKDCRTGK